VEGVVSRPEDCAKAMVAVPNKMRASKNIFFMEFSPAEKKLK
jgi:hypothetical protein